MVWTASLTRAALVTAGAAVLSLVAAAPAAADTPVGWEDSDGMGLIQSLLLFGGGAAAISLVVTGLVLAPSLIRGSRRESGQDWWQEPQWFGGGGLESPSGRERAALPAGTHDPSGGGASARW